MKKLLAGLTFFLFCTSAFAVDPQAKRIQVTDAGFVGNFNQANCDNVQECLETIDALSVGGGSGDITAVGDVTSGAAFDGTQGTTLTFNNAGGDATLDYDGTDFSLSKAMYITTADAVSGLDVKGSGVTNQSFRVMGSNGVTTGIGWRSHIIGVNYTLGADNIPETLTTTSYLDSAAIGFASLTNGNGMTFWTGSGAIGTNLSLRMKITNAGLIGLGTSAPENALDVNSDTGANLQLTYNDSDGSAANKVNFAVSSSGDLTITPSGGDITITNRLSTRLLARSDTVASSATPTINTDTTDIFTITALATAVTSMTSNLSGTPVNGQKLTVRFLDNGTARAITWGASFASRGATLPTTTVLSKYTYVGLFYNSTALVWDCVAVSTEA